MYRVLYDERILFDPYVDDAVVTDANLTQELNASPFFDFTVSPKNPLYEDLEERKGVIRLYSDGKLLFKGEIESISSDMEGYKVCSCISALDYLNDTCVRPYSTNKDDDVNLFPPSSVSGYFKWLIDQHNEHVLDAKKRFSIGVNQGDYFTNGRYIQRSSSSNPTTAEEIQNQIIDSLGGYLFLRYDGDESVLDLYADIHDSNAQIIDFGVNLVDFTKTVDTSDQYTALIPKGGSPTFENGGFDTGDFGNWVVYHQSHITSDEVHSGDYSAYFLTGSCEFVNESFFYSKPGWRYESTIWVKNERSSDVAVYARYQYQADNSEWVSVIVEGKDISVPNDGEWHEFTFDFLPELEEGTKIRPQWYFDGAGADGVARVYVDDASFSRIDGDETVSEDPIGIDHIPDGLVEYETDIAKRGDVLYCVSAVQRYGYKEKAWEDNTITDEDVLLKDSVKNLRKIMEPSVSLDVKAVDLALYMSGYEHLLVGQAVRVRSVPHKVDEYLVVNSINLDLQDPAQTDYGLGVAFDALTGQQSAYVRSLNSGINNSLDSVAALDQSVKDQAVQIGSVEAIANDAKDTANNAQNTANSAQQAAQDAQNSASSALDKAEAAEGAVNEIQGMIDDINSGAEQAKQDAAQAKADAQQAAAKADAASQAAQAAANKADALEGSITDVTTTVNGVVQDIEEITTSVTGAISTANEALSAASSASQDLEGFKTTVSQTYQLKGDYATNTDLDEAIAEEVLNRNSAIEQSASSITSTVSQTYATKTDLAVTDGKAAQAQSVAQQAQTSASNAQSTANAANNTANGVAEDLTDYMETVATTYASKSELEQTSESITATVEANYTEVKQLANTAQSTADSALSKANEASGELADFTESVTSDLSDLQSQIDGNIATWFYAGTPTLTNEPAVNWTTTEEKNQHLGDLYYDTNTGYAYRFMLQNGAYSWGRITDSDVTKALEDAANAQDTADSKRRVFVSQPTPPYDVGDLWVQGENGDILRCATARASGSYNASDWVLASRYTDDSALEIFEGQVADIYSTKAELETATDAITATVEENFEKSVLVKEADGGVVDCGDTAGMPLAGLTVYGQTRQNLWVNPNTSHNSVSATSNADGSVKVSGTPTAQFNLHSAKSFVLRPGSTYYLSCSPAPSGFIVGISQYVDGSFKSTKRMPDGGGAVTIDSDVDYVTFVLYGEATGTPLSGTYRVMLNEGDTAQPWCPPGLNSVEKVSVNVSGGNLLSSDAEEWGVSSNTTVDIDGDNITVSSTSGAYRYAYFSFGTTLNGKTVSLGYESVSATGINAPVMQFIYTVDGVTKYPSNRVQTIPENAQQVRITLYSNNSNVDGAASVTYVKPYLRIDGEAEYLPLSGFTSTEIPLLGNKISSLPDGTRDELTVDAGGNVVLRKKTHQQVIVGDDLLYRYTSNTVWITLFNNPILDYEHPYDASLSIEDNAAFSDKIPYYPIGNTGAHPVFNNSRIGISTTSQNAPQAVYVNTPLNTTVAEAREWLNDNPVQFLYALKDPYDIPLGHVDFPDLAEQNAHVWISTSTQGLDPDIHATWYGENASALKDFASKAELKVESDQIKATVEETYSTKEEVSAVEDKADAAQDALDSYKNTVSTTYATKSEVTQTANSIKSEVSETYTTKAEFDGLEVGGRNLLYDTKDMTVKKVAGNAQRYYTTYFNNVGTGGGLSRTADGIKLTFGSTVSVSIQAPLASFGNVENNETATLSFTYRGNITSFGTWYFLQQTLPNVSVGGFPGLNADGQWHEYKHTFSSSQANVRTCVSVLMFYDLSHYDKTKWVEIKEGTLKLEKGNKATDWSPAPEDMLSTADASATYATKQSVTTVEQTVDGLKSTVSSNYTTLNNKFNSYYNKTEVDQKDNSIKSTVSSVQTTANNALEKASTVEQTADGLEVRLIQAEKDVDTAQTTANTAKSTASTANTTANAAKTAAANAQTAAQNAAKTATNYLKFDSSGLCVGNQTTTLGYNTLIKSGGVDIRNGSTTLASYSASEIKLGNNSNNSRVTFGSGYGHVGIDPSNYPAMTYIDSSNGGKVEVTHNVSLKTAASTSYGSKTILHAYVYEKDSMIWAEHRSGNTYSQHILSVAESGRTLWSGTMNVGGSATINNLDRWRSIGLGVPLGSTNNVVEAYVICHFMGSDTLLFGIGGGATQTDGRIAFIRLGRSGDSLSYLYGRTELIGSGATDNVRVGPPIRTIVGIC